MRLIFVFFNLLAVFEASQILLVTCKQVKGCGGLLPQTPVAKFKSLKLLCFERPQKNNNNSPNLIGHIFAEPVA
jgi:hypothetical protein